MVGAIFPILMSNLQSAFVKTPFIKTQASVWYLGAFFKARPQRWAGCVLSVSFDGDSKSQRLVSDFDALRWISSASHEGSVRGPRKVRLRNLRRREATAEPVPAQKGSKDIRDAMPIQCALEKTNGRGSPQARISTKSFSAWEKRPARERPGHFTNAPSPPALNDLVSTQ